MRSSWVLLICMIRAEVGFEMEEDIGDEEDEGGEKERDEWLSMIDS